MKKYIVSIEGVANMLQNRLSRELNKEIKAIPNDRKDDWEDANWERKAYTSTVDGEKVYILTPEVIQSTLINACRYFKTPPPKSVGKTWTNYFKSSVVIEEPAILKNVSIEPFGTMVNGNPSSMKKGSKVYRVRPMIKIGWKTNITITDIGDYLTKDLIFEIVRSAGAFVGFCDWRPNYGRFAVENVKVLEVD